MEAETAQKQLDFKRPIRRPGHIHARRASAEQLRMTLNLLSDHLPHTTREIIDKTNRKICAVSPVMSELRENGFDIRCQPIIINNKRRFAYRWII